ncbi:hypothetical protein ACVA51_09505 [Pseudomonas luteola]
MMIDWYLRIRHACSQTSVFEVCFAFGTAFVLLFLPVEQASGLAKRLREHSAYFVESTAFSSDVLFSLSDAEMNYRAGTLTSCSI